MNKWKHIALVVLEIRQQTCGAVDRRTGRVRHQDPVGKDLDVDAQQVIEPQHQKQLDYGARERWTDRIELPAIDEGV